MRRYCFLSGRSVGFIHDASWLLLRYARSALLVGPLIRMPNLRFLVAFTIRCLTAYMYEKSRDSCSTSGIYSLLCPFNVAH